MTAVSHSSKVEVEQGEFVSVQPFKVALAARTPKTQRLRVVPRASLLALIAAVMESCQVEVRNRDFVPLHPLVVALVET